MRESSEKAVVGGWLVTLLALLALLALSGCDRKPAEPPKPKSAALIAPVESNSMPLPVPMQIPGQVKNPSANDGGKRSAPTTL